MSRCTCSVNDTKRIQCKQSQQAAEDTINCVSVSASVCVRVGLPRPFAWASQCVWAVGSNPLAKILGDDLTCLVQNNKRLSWSKRNECEARVGDGNLGPFVRATTRSHLPWSAGEGHWSLEGTCWRWAEVWGRERVRQLVVSFTKKKNRNRAERRGGEGQSVVHVSDGI